MFCREESRPVSEARAIQGERMTPEEQRDEAERLVAEYLEAHKTANNPEWAIWRCKAYWEQCRREECAVLEASGFFAAPEVEWSDFPAGEADELICSLPFPSYLPDRGDDLPTCPGCGGPTELVELLEPAQH